MLDLTPDQIADAETVGVSFPLATPDQVRRYTMQRKVFRVGGEAVLATRDGALFETAATLERLIADGERQRRDMATWEASTPATAVEPPAPPTPRPVEATTRPPAPIAPPSPLAARKAKPRQVPRAERWLTAGAKRRGRLVQHWSLRGAR